MHRGEDNDLEPSSSSLEPSSSSNKKSRLMKRVDEKNEMKNSIDTSESVDNNDDYGYAVKDIITINHDILNTTTNKRK